MRVSHDELEEFRSVVSPKFASFLAAQVIVDEEILQISTLRMPVKNLRLGGYTVELEIAFQSGKTMAVVVFSTQKVLLDALRPGTYFA
jgi:hypothetical protein